MRDTGGERTQARDRPESAHRRSTPWIGPVYGLASGLLRWIAFPRAVTQWPMIQLSSLTVAGAVPESTSRVSTASRFTPQAMPAGQLIARHHRDSAPRG